MANNVAITAGSGTTVCTTDITSFSAYSTTGQIPAGTIYCSANTSTAPAPVTNANPLPVAVQSSASLPVVVASDQTAIPASLNSAAINVGTTALTPKFAAVAASSSGNNTVVSAVTGKKIRVLGYRLSANGTVAAKWRSSTAGDISGLSYLIQYASAGASFSPVGHFETASGEGLQLNLDAGVAVGGHLAYIEV